MVKTDTVQRTGEFLVSEAPGTLSREVIDLVQSADPYVDGTPINSTGAVYDGTGTFAGILYGNYDASEGAVEAVYIARLAEVDDTLIHYADYAKNETLTAMAAVHIRTHPRLNAADAPDTEFTETETAT